MILRTRLVIPIVLAAAAAGCGWFGPPEPPPPIPPVTSIYDTGPRAGEAPYMPVWAVEGESLFVRKGCKACHAYGIRLTGPDLKGVTRQRSAEWMEQQILHPDIMTVEDPISMQLKAEYLAQMANVGLTPQEARSVIEFLKKLDEQTEEREGPHAFDHPTPPPFQAPIAAPEGTIPPEWYDPGAAQPPEVLAPGAPPETATSVPPPS